MSLDGNVSYLLCIIMKPTPSSPHQYLAWIQRTFLTHTQNNFEYPVSKGYTPKINLMDNQATKAIKSYLTPQQYHLQLVKPGNHCANAAEYASKHSRFISSVPLAQRTLTSQFNSGTSSHHRCKTPSTSSKDPESNQTYQHLKHSRGLNIVIVFLLRPSKQKQ